MRLVTRVLSSKCASQNGQARMRARFHSAATAAVCRGLGRLSRACTGQPREGPSVAAALGCTILAAPAVCETNMILYYLLTTFYILICFVLLFCVLLQQGKGDIAAAFGGGSSQSAFGARGGATLLSKATAVLAALFMLGALVLAIIGQRGPGSLMSGTSTPVAPRPVNPPPATPTAPAPATPTAPK